MFTVFLVSCLLYLLISILSLFGDEVGELYTDIYIYMYLRRMGLAGRFGIGVLICILLLVTYFGA